jgi:hypothetical protein
MSNQPPVKTPLSESAPAADTDAPEPGSPATPDPQVATLLRLLRPVAEPKVHPQAEARLALATGIEVSLDAHWLRVLQGDTVLIESPLATGRALSPTPEGTFTVSAKPPLPSSLRYGHYRTKTGALLLRGVFPKIDPLPPEAVFDQIVPKGLIKLSGDGPMMFGGEATGAATTDGALVLPDRIALLLHEKLPLGVPVVIAR